MAPKKPCVDKLNTYWSKMKPAASRTPSFKAMGLLLECLNSCYKIVKIRGKHERSIPELRLLKSKRQPRKRKVVDPESNKGAYNPETNPKLTSTKHKEKVNLFEDKSMEHDDGPVVDMGYDDQSKDDEKLTRDALQHNGVEKSKKCFREPQQKIVDQESTKDTDNLETNPKSTTKHKEKVNLFEDKSMESDDEPAEDMGNDDQSEDDEKPTKDAHHVEVEKIKRRFSERQRQIRVEYGFSETEIKKNKKKKDQSSSAKSRKFNFEPTSTRSLSPIKDQRDQEILKDVERVEKNLPNRIQMIRGWSIMLQCFLLKASSLSLPCTKDEIKMIYQEKHDSFKEKGEECLPFDDVFHHFVTKNNQATELLRIIENKKQVYIVAETRKRGETNTTTDLTENFPEMYRRRINTVNNVVGDGNCGFRAIAMALDMPKGQEDWPLVREQMLKELNDHEELYRVILGELHGLKNITEALDHQDGGKMKDKWMVLPDMGHLVATTYNVGLLVLAKFPVLYLPLRLGPPKKSQKTIICIGYVQDDHFLELDLKSDWPDWPLPEVNCQWEPNKYPEAEEWRTRLKTNFELYDKEFVPTNDSKSPIKLDD